MKKPLRRQRSRIIKLIVVLVLVIVVVILASFVQQKLSNDKAEKPIATVPSFHTVSYEKGARAVADAYFDAVKHCDVAKANSYRLLPKDVTAANVAKCQQECPEGITYEFMKQQNDLRQDRKNTETGKVVILEYEFGCNEEKQITLLTMDFSYSDNRWQVVNSL
jgi:hypothetical protein